MTTPPFKSLALSFGVLSPSDIPDILHLQETVYCALPQERKNAFVRKTEAQLLKRMTTHGTMLGAFEGPPQNQQLIACGNVALPQDDFPVADMVLTLNQIPFAPGTFAVLQTNLVAPGYTGCGIHDTLLSMQKAACLCHGKPNVLAEIVTSNGPSLKNFLSKDFHIWGIGKAHNDGRPLFFLSCAIENQPRIQPEKNVLAPDPASPSMFDELKALFAMGYVGTKIERVESPLGSRNVLYLNKLMPTG